MSKLKEEVTSSDVVSVAGDACDAGVVDKNFKCDCNNKDNKDNKNSKCKCNKSNKIRTFSDIVRRDYQK